MSVRQVLFIGYLCLVLLVYVCVWYYGLLFYVHVLGVLFDCSPVAAVIVSTVIYWALRHCVTLYTAVYFMLLFYIHVLECKEYYSLCFPALLYKRRCWWWEAWGFFDRLSGDVISHSRDFPAAGVRWKNIINHEYISILEEGGGEPCCLCVCTLNYWGVWECCF